VDIVVEEEDEVEEVELGNQQMQLILRLLLLLQAKQEQLEFAFLFTPLSIPFIKSTQPQHGPTGVKFIERHPSFFLCEKKNFFYTPLPYLLSFVFRCQLCDEKNKIKKKQKILKNTFPASLRCAFLELN
jgi:hypothetical protein